MAERLNVISWNILLDKKRTQKGLIRPQDERVDQLIETLQGFDGSHDVVGLQEVEATNGQTISRALGYGDGLWHQHNKPIYKGASRGRSNEYMGMFGAMVEYTEPIDIGDRRKAVLTRVGGVAIVNCHLISGRSRKTLALRTQEMQAILDAITDEENAVLIGDTNGHPLEASRRLAHREGFRSAHVLANGHMPRTHPNPEYIDALADDLLHRKLFYRYIGSAIDTISIRGDGLSVVAAGTLQEPRQGIHDEDIETSKAFPSKGASDHIGLWARLAIET
jgi:endonuclease/exonuclease/phosphatase family metal-dependent hydrolase